MNFGGKVEKIFWTKPFCLSQKFAQFHLVKNEIFPYAWILQLLISSAWVSCEEKSFITMTRQ
jgi:hypothetical protein